MFWNKTTFHSTSITSSLPSLFIVTDTCRVYITWYENLTAPSVVHFVSAVFLEIMIVWKWLNKGLFSPWQSLGGCKDPALCQLLSPIFSHGLEFLGKLSQVAICISGWGEVALPLPSRCDGFRPWTLALYFQNVENRHFSSQNPGREQ